MKYLPLILCSFIFFTASVGAQEKLKDLKNKKKIEILSHKEKEEIENWFLEQIDGMGLLEEQAAEYISILVYYMTKISRLDHKKGLSEKQFKAELNKIIAQQDADLQEILTPEQFKMHKEIYGEFLKTAYKRWGIEE